MQIAPIPETEVERLAELASYNILDTDPESDFDEIIRLASYICGTPISTITLVDESRQWFKSSQGLDIQETPREHAFCAHTILQREALVVNDAREDSRFFDNPLVTANPNIRFYAGVPLVSPGGHALGSLCAIDNVPRQLTDAQLAALNTLAKQVMKNMEVRRTYVKLQTLALKLNRVNEGKNRLFSMIAHDLKSPLGGIISMLELISQDAASLGSTELQEKLVMLTNSANSTFGVMQDLLQWSTFESGAMPYSPADYRLDDILKGAIAIVQSNADRKSIRLTFEANSQMMVHAYRSMVHSIVQNLLSNAIKFCPDGGAINVNSRQDGGWAVVAIADDGVGMSPAQVATILQGDGVGSSHGTAGESGTGLGLNLCRSFVQKHGGVFGVTSTPGAGSRFTFTVPVAMV